jgi:mono/diheme cytochrome c family protein
LSDAPRLAVALAALAVGVAACTGGGDAAVGGDLVGDPVAGGQLYTANCAACHGEDLRGAAAGPSLVDDAYAPSVFSDEAVRLAITNGADARLWDFGPMPAIGGLDAQDVADIVSHVREQQRAAGLE